MITIISHFNENNITGKEHICSQNASPKDSDKEEALQSLLTPTPRDVRRVSPRDAVLSALWVLPGRECLHPFKSVLLPPPQRTVSRWFKFKTKFENQARIIFVKSINDTFLLFSFLSVLIALNFITIQPSKLNPPFFSH